MDIFNVLQLNQPNFSISDARLTRGANLLTVLSDNGLEALDLKLGQRLEAQLTQIAPGKAEIKFGDTVLTVVNNSAAGNQGRTTSGTAATPSPLQLAGKNLQLTVVALYPKPTFAVISPDSAESGQEAADSTYLNRGASDLAMRLASPLRNEALSGQDILGGKSQPIPENLAVNQPTRVSLTSAAKVASQIPWQSSSPGRIIGKDGPLLGNVKTIDTLQWAQALKSALGESGLFYEAHQAEWVQGVRAFASLLREPQAQMVPAVEDKELPMSTSIFSAGDANKSALVTKQPEALTHLENESTRQILVDLSELGSQPESASAQQHTGGVPSVLIPLTDDSLPSANKLPQTLEDDHSEEPVSSAATTSNRYQLGSQTSALLMPGLEQEESATPSQLSGKIQFNETQRPLEKVGGDLENGPVAVDQLAPYSPRASNVVPTDSSRTEPSVSSNLRQLEAVYPTTPPEALSYVLQQLQTLQTKQVAWEGWLWPQAWAEWQTEEGPGDEGGSADRKDGVLASWTTAVKLHLPNLGQVAATLQLSSQGMVVNLSAASANTTELLKAKYFGQAERLAERGITVWTGHVEQA